MQDGRVQYMKKGRGTHGAQSHALSSAHSGKSAHCKRNYHIIIISRVILARRERYFSRLSCRYLPHTRKHLAAPKSFDRTLRPTGNFSSLVFRLAASHTTEARSVCSKIINIFSILCIVCRRTNLFDFGATAGDTLLFTDDECGLL